MLISFEARNLHYLFKFLWKSCLITKVPAKRIEVVSFSLFVLYEEIGGGYKKKSLYSSTVKG